MTNLTIPSPTVGVGVGVMIVRAGKLFLGKRKSNLGQGTYGWCGGHVEFGETIEEAAKREVYEESGLIVTSLKFLCVSNVIAYDRHYIDFEFLGQVEPGEPEVKEPDTVESWDWYEFDQLPSPLFKAVEYALDSYKTGHPYYPGY